MVAGGISAATLLVDLFHHAGGRVEFTTLMIGMLCWGVQIWSEPHEPRPTPLWAKTVLTVWVVTLPVTLLFAALSGMAGEGGYNLAACVVIGAAFTYPLSIVVAFIFSRTIPRLVFLPCLNIVLWLLVGSVPPH